jgi:hypothetical protein
MGIIAIIIPIIMGITDIGMISERRTTIVTIIMIGELIQPMLAIIFTMESTEALICIPSREKKAGPCTAGPTLIRGLRDPVTIPG